MICIKSYESVDSNDYDEVWMIVRSWSDPDPDMRHVPDLSPSLELLNKYLALREKGEWNYEKFTTVYLPQFLQEFHDNSSVTQPLLEELCQKSKAGKNICLACFCMDETICHRSIIAGFLQDKGITVQTETGNDYRELIHYMEAKGK